MAKNRKARRKMGRYIRGNVDEETGLGTLAARTLISQDFDEAVSERTLISSLVAAYTLSDLTVATNVGPIMVGIAHSDYLAAEIEAFIEATDSWAEPDLVAQEVAKRKIRVIGIFDAGDPALSGHALNDGKPIKTKLNWILGTGQTLQLWAYNLGSAAVGTSVPEVHCQGHANLWPR